jgi:acetylornithine deacetylase/succinyl-diaminopimelate desuccinylase-like protein
MSVDPALRLLRDLVAIDSVNPTLVPGAAGEAAIADTIAGEMRRAGLDVVVQPVAPGRPNVIGALDGAAPGRSIMFCGHIDTVGVTGMGAPFSPEERDGRLYGRGAQDMKGGVAAMIDAAATLARRGLRSGRVIVACVVDEEHSSIGADALVKEWHADAAIVTEPTDMQVAVGHKGFEWVEVAVRGKAAHGSRPAEGVDAIFRLGRVLGRLEALDRDLQRRVPHPRLGTGSLHASTVRGGHELSSYPDEAVLQFERRTLPGDALTVGVAESNEICKSLAREDPSFLATTRQLFARQGYEIPPDHELPQIFCALLKQADVPAAIAGASFWTDAAILAHAGIPSILFGPHGAGLHSTEEYVVIEDVLRCRDVLVDAALRWC